MEDYVTYEQAVKLKERGFDWECLYYYEYDELCGNTQSFENEENICICAEGFLKRHNIAYPGSYTYSAPTLAQAAKWLRERGLFVNVWLCAAGYSWSIEKCGKYNGGTFVAKHDEESGDDVDSGLFTTYERALSSGIDEALKLIKKNG